MSTANVPTTAAQLRYSLRQGDRAYFVDHRDAYRAADALSRSTGKPVQVVDAYLGDRIVETVDSAATIALARVTIDRATADYRLHPSEYAALRAAIESGDWMALTDETHEVRSLLGDWCRVCRSELHDGSPSEPLDSPYCSRRCAEEGEA